MSRFKNVHEMLINSEKTDRPSYINIAKGKYSIPKNWSEIIEAAKRNKRSRKNGSK